MNTCLLVALALACLGLSAAFLLQQRRADVYQRSAERHRDRICNYELMLVAMIAHLEEHGPLTAFAGEEAGRAYVGCNECGVTADCWSHIEHTDLCMIVHGEQLAELARDTIGDPAIIWMRGESNEPIRRIGADPGANKVDPGDADRHRD